MFSSSRWIAGGCSLALTLAFAIAAEPLAAQSAAQDTVRKQGPMPRPMNMPMGKTAQKKKTRKTSTTSKPGVRNNKKTLGRSASPGAPTKKGVAPSTSHPMPMGAAPHHPPPIVGQKQSIDSIHAMKGDSAHVDMSRMKMQPAPTRADSMKMPGMDMSSGPIHSTGLGMAGMTAKDMMTGPAGVSMERMGSGTTWIPDAITLPSRERMLGSWMIMTHGFVFAQYDKQSGERGDDQLGSLNWVMLMATRDFVGSRFQARTMLSLDPFTVSNRGYPLLLQTGETYKGQPLHDRQHPHDFWMELGTLYQREINKGLAWSVYAAPSGEPALSPVAFMHRPSAMDNPAAPLGHHWQDATHVSFGVLTGGVYSGKWQLEGSLFNGREPDENRWNFDPIKLDSYSGRLTVNPTAHWSLTAGYGYLKSPEVLKPDESLHRFTASALHGARLAADGQWGSAFIWGANKHSASANWSSAFLAESEAIIDARNTLFGRAELVQKNAEELVVDIPVATRNGTLLPPLPSAIRESAFCFSFLRRAISALALLRCALSCSVAVMSSRRSLSSF